MARRSPSRQLRFLTPEQRRQRPDDLEYRVMVFEPKGMYPRGTWQVPNGFFHADDRIAFSLVHGESWAAIRPAIPFSEFDWASPQELRLISSMILCEVMDGRPMQLYPIVRFGPLLDAAGLDLTSSETPAQVRDLLLSHAAQPATLPSQWSSLVRLRGKYDIVDPNEYALDRLPDFWGALATPNYVLLRGVYALMKSDMLSHHYEFFEEAVISLQIALDACFSLVRRQLGKEGHSDPSAHDAAVWLHKHFDAPFGLPAPGATEKFFGEFYEQRVMTLHPASRYGDVPYSPTMHDDVYHLRRSLRQLFAYLLTGRHDPGYEDALRDHIARGFPPA